MICTTLGYLEKDGKWLMLHRISKKNDISKDKWIGIGGKVEEGESPLACMIRECREETGLTWKDPQLKGIITFNYRKEASDPLFCEQMFLFSGGTFSGKMKDCDEGHLEWVDMDSVSSLPLWKGDLIFFSLLKENSPLFFLELNYTGDRLLSAFLDGKPVNLESI